MDFLLKFMKLSRNISKSAKITSVLYLMKIVLEDFCNWRNIWWKMHLLNASRITTTIFIAWLLDTYPIKFKLNLPVSSRTFTTKMNYRFLLSNCPNIDIQCFIFPKNKFHCFASCSKSIKLKMISLSHYLLRNSINFLHLISKNYWQILIIFLILSHDSCQNTKITK